MKTSTCLLLFTAFTLAFVGTSAASKKAEEGGLRVVVLGAHCDDPETGAGGLIALLTEAGHEVVVGHATCFRGDRKFFGQPEAIVRRREATAACKIMGVTPKFFELAESPASASARVVVLGRPCNPLAWEAIHDLSHHPRSYRIAGLLLKAGVRPFHRQFLSE